MNKLKVRLLSITKSPVITLYRVWLQSRPQLWDDLKSYGIERDEYKKLEELYNSGNPEFVEYIEKTVSLILSTSLPPAEAVQVTWQFDNVSVAVREQLVRHRTTSPWIQSSRNNTDSASFEGFIPKSVSDNPEALSIVESTYDTIRENFNQLLNLGIPSEDARCIMPEGRLHNLCWTMNLRDLYKIMKERSCWIAQGSLWSDICLQMQRELESEGLHLFASKLGTPPCNYRSCIYRSENENRLDGKDILPVCPLYCKQCGIEYPEDTQDMDYYRARTEFLGWDDRVISAIRR